MYLFPSLNCIHLTIRLIFLNYNDTQLQLYIYRAELYLCVYIQERAADAVHYCFCVRACKCSTTTYSIFRISKYVRSDVVESNIVCCLIYYIHESVVTEMQLRIFLRYIYIYNNKTSF